MTSHRKQNVKLPNVSGWNPDMPRHSFGFTAMHRVRTTVAMTITAVLVFIVSAVGISAYALITAPNSIKSIAQGGKQEEIVDPNAGKPIEFLLMGQDTREGAGNTAIGGRNSDEIDLHNADTTMVVQISADRSYINLVSIPRDSIVDAPSCDTSQGKVPAQSNVMFNSIFASGWSKGNDLASAAGCTLHAVNSLTGLNLQHFIVVDFQGLKDMIDAIGGVNVCIPVDMKDNYTSLDLKHGMNHLDGTQATQYARMRHGTGTDGSDIMRTTRQQYLIKELMNEALSKNLLTNGTQLYRLANSALKSLSISEGLSNASTLVGLGMSLKNIKLDHLYMRTLPVIPSPRDLNRVVWSSAADDVWAKLQENKPLNAQEAAPSNDSGTQDSTSAPQDSDTSQAPQPDPKTGLITDQSGRLIDPATGGIVDPSDGSIRDPNTGQYIGIANQYLNQTICAVPAAQ